MQSKDKQQPTLDLLFLTIKKYLQQNQQSNASNNLMSSPELIKTNIIDQMIKKLQKTLYEIINCYSYTEDQSTQKKQKQEEQKFIDLVDLLIQPILEQDKYICLQWLTSIIKIHTKCEKTESIYQLAKQIRQDAVIALPYDFPGLVHLPAPPPSITTIVSDSATQQQKVEQRKYFEQDELIVTKYFETSFYTVKRQGISQFSHKIVQHICKNLIQPFFEHPNKLHCLETYIKFTDFLNGISGSIYTYYLISCFKNVLEKLKQILASVKINTSINSQRINGLIYNLGLISSRWQGSVYYNKLWQWQIKSKAILGMLESNVSQTKLTAVKMLIQFCRKVEYSTHKPEDIQKYIKQNSILQLIFSPDNHPEVVSKGKQIYQFLCKYDILEQQQIDILLNLIDKSHENVSKSIYITIQSLGQNNLTVYHRKIISRIQKLTRASFFNDQTLQLLETLLVIAPAIQIKQNMTSIYNIIKKHYTKFRKHLRQKLVRLYFQLFIIGVQQNIFVEQDKTNVITPISDNLGTNLSALLLDSFIKVIKNQAGKNIVGQCKQILKQSINALFKKYKIHNVQVKDPVGNYDKTKINRNNYKQILVSNPLYYSKQVHNGIIKYLLQSYQGDEIPISYEDLCSLIDKDITFTKFIQYYHKKQQIQAIETMLTHPNKGFQHLSNIVQAYSLICSDAKQEVLNKIKNWFFQTKEVQQKISLGQFIINNSFQQQKLEQLCHKITELSNSKCDIQENKLLSFLILLKYMLIKQDKKGLGTHLPYSYSSNCYDVLVKVTNSIDVLKPTQYQLESQSYQNLSEIISKILQHDNLTISGVNFKINDKYMSISDLQDKIGEIAKKIYKNQNNFNQFKYQISIIVFDVFESEWFDKSQLINHGILASEVIIALTQIFTKFTIAGKMHRSESVKVFEIATETQKISVQDTRIQHLYSHYSMNGQYLTLEEWLNFYQKSSQDNPGVVIENLRRLGYGHLFKNQKQVLHQYQKIQQNYVRDYLYEVAVSMYDVLFKKYKNAQLNKFCQQLLKLLPLHRKYIISHQNEMGMIQQKKQRRKQKIEININYVIQGLISIDLSNTRQLWYSLGLLNQICFSKDNENKNNYRLQIFENIKVVEYLLKMLSIQMEKMKDINITFIQPLQIQLTSYLTKIIKQFYLQKSGDNLIWTLRNESIKKQNHTQILDKIQDPIKITNIIPQSIIKIKPKLKFELILKFTYNLFTNDSSQYKLRWQSKEKLVCIIDELLIIYLQSNKQILQQKQIISNQLIFNNNVEVRSIYNNFYFLLCQVNAGIKVQYYAINLQQLSSMLNKQDKSNNSKNDQHRYDQFFKTFNKMLGLQTTQNQCTIYDKVSKQIQKSIRQYVNISSNNSNKQMQTQSKCLVISTNINIGACNYVDNILLGQLTILDTIKLYAPELQISNPEQWLNKLLQQPHSNQTLSILYRMSHNLCSVQYNLKNLSNTMNGLAIHRNSQIRKINRMGLFNLGCICYINSTLQQLFMIQPFRKAIISANIQQYDPSNYFYQFQYLIYQLQFGKRQFFIPDNFCLTYTDFENKPIDIKQQHDADQFLNSLLDRLENTLKHKNNNNNSNDVSQLIRSNFCGQLANVITCQACYNYNVKVQDFYILTLQIKNNKNLLQCFQKLTQPQSITDYYCQKCDRKVQLIQKQLSIKKLPNFLIIHLQRLVFDLDTLSKIKLQHLIDYPEQLDLSEFYSHDLCNQQQVKYKFILKGFVVHIGTSQSGHYYSLIKDNGKWIKFDDSRVDQWKWDQSSRDKQGTYLLIYQKIQMNGNNQSMQKIKDKQLINIGNIQMYQKVEQDNQMLVKQTIFLQKPFGSHLIQTLSRIQIPYQLLTSSPNQLQVPFHPTAFQILQPKHKQQYTQAHDIILSYLQLVSQSKGISSYQYNAVQIKNITSYLILLLHINPQLIQRTVQHLLKGKQPSKISTQILRRVLTHPDKTIRQAYKLVFTKVLSILTFATSQVYHSFFLPALEETQLWVVQKVFEYMLGSLYDAAKNYNRMEQHFQLFGLIMQMGDKCCVWFQQQLLGPKLVHFICSDDTAMKNQFVSYNYQSPKKSDAINTITTILGKMIKIYLSKPINNNNNTNKQQQLSTQTMQYKAYVTTKWYKKIYQSRYNYQQVNQSLGLLASRDTRMSIQLCQFIVQKINRFSHSDQYILAYIHLLQVILSINNSQSRSRYEYILGIPRIFVDSEDIITTDNTRYYKYWSNQLTSTDQFILPFLQLLYTNRQQTNYFTLSATTVLLNLIIKYTSVQQYVLGLPAPLLYQYYTEWIIIQLKNGIKRQASNNKNSNTNNSNNNNSNSNDNDGNKYINIGRFDHKVIVNQIARLLNIVQQKYIKQTTKNNNNNEMIEQGSNKMQMQMNMQQQNKIFQQQQPFTIRQNEANKYFRLSGYIKQTTTIIILPQHTQQNIEQYEIYKITGTILQDGQKHKLIKYKFILVNPVFQNTKISIRFKQNNYNYGFIVKCQQFQLVCPIPQQFVYQQVITANSLFTITYIDQPPIHNNNNNNNNNNRNNNNNNNNNNSIDNNNNNSDINNAMDIQQQKDGTVIQLPDTNNSNNNNSGNGSNEQIFQCPFCTSISFSFSSRCPTCGEEWGQMM